MEVKFETFKGRRFTMEVGFFDTVRNIKKKIEKYHGFDRKMIALFTAELTPMRNCRNVETYNVLEGSTLKLRVLNETEPEDKPPVEISVKVVVAPGKTIDTKVDVMKTVGYLKKNIERKFGIPAECFVLWYDGTELLDLRVLAEYWIEDGSELLAITG